VNYVYLLYTSEALTFLVGLLQDVKKAFLIAYETLMVREMLKHIYLRS